MLTPAQIDTYRDQGYLLVSGLFRAAELEAMESEFDGIITRRLANRAQLDATWPGTWKNSMPQMQIVHTHDVQAYSAVWTRVLVHDGFTQVLSELMGSPNVQLHHTKLFQKPPEKGAAFPMHQDAPYFPHERHTMMAGIIHLSDADLSMGCVRVYPGSHKLGLLPEADSQAHYLDPAQWPIEKATPCPARRGDVLFFHYLTIHGSGLNTSQRTRKTVLVQVRDPADRPTVDTHRSHAQGLMMRGIDPLVNKTTAEGTLGWSPVAETAATGR